MEEVAQEPPLLGPNLCDHDIQRLPNELVFDILKLRRHDRRALLHVSETCKRLRSLAIPVLLHSVTLDLITSPGHATSLLAMLGSRHEAGRFVRRMELRVSALNIPQDLLRLLKIVVIEDLQIKSSVIPGTLFDAIIKIPSLRSLNLQSSSIFPKDTIRVPVEGDLYRAQLRSLEIHWQETGMTTSLPAILSRLDMSKLQHLSLSGGSMIARVSAQTLSSLTEGSLTTLKFPPVNRDSALPDPYLLLRDTLVNQPNLRHLKLHAKVHFNSFPSDALPNLGQFEGSCAMAELLVPGRPVTQVTITTESKFGEGVINLQPTFEAIQKSIKHLTYLEFDEMLFDEAWMIDLPTLFPYLEELRVQSINYINKGFMRMTMPRHIAKMTKCKSIKIRCRGGGSQLLNLLHMPDPAELKWAEQTVQEWSKRNPTLQEVWMGRLALIKVATSDWKAYDEFHFRGPAEAYNIPLRMPDQLP